MSQGLSFFSGSHNTQLAFAEYGTPTGTPVLYAHGFPSSLLEGELFAGAAVRLIVFERSGFGQSEFTAKRTVLSWADDAALLGNHLRLEQFAVMGYSGGVPFALACAAKLPERVTTAICINGLAPADYPQNMQGISSQHRAAMLLARHAPWLLGFFLRKMQQAMQSGAPPKTPLPAADSAALEEHRQARLVLRQTVLRGLMQGTRAAVFERNLLTKPWGFDPAQIRVPVHIWQGLEDTNVSPLAARRLASSIPDCQAHFLPNEGHVSLLLRHQQRILDCLGA